MVLVLGAGLPSLPNELRHHTTAEVARDLRTYPFREGHMACASNTTCECDQGWGGEGMSRRALRGRVRSRQVPAGAGLHVRGVGGLQAPPQLESTTQFSKFDSEKIYIHMTALST